MALDLTIFTFDEPLTEPQLDVKDQGPEEEYYEGPIWDDEMKARPQFTFSEEEILEDELSVYSDHILKKTTLKLHEAKEVVENNNNEKPRAKVQRNRTRTTKVKNERMAAKLTKEVDFTEFTSEKDSLE